jgi:hypothetical protein
MPTHKYWQHRHLKNNQGICLRLSKAYLPDSILNPLANDNELFTIEATAQPNKFSDQAKLTLKHKS